MNELTPRWLIQAKLKSRQLDSESNALREQYVALQNEISDISIDRLKLEERQAGFIKHRDLLGGLKSDDVRVVANEKQISTLQDEIDLLNDAIAGARTRQEAIQTTNAPLSNLAAGARRALQAVQGQSSLSRVGSI